MIVPKLWIMLSEVHQRLLQHVHEKKPDSKSPLDADAVANEHCWNFCERSKGVFLHSGGEKAIEYPKESYVAPPEGGKHLPANEILDLRVGVPGSGTTKYVFFGKGPSILGKTGPYIGSPVVFKRKEFEKYLLTMNKETNSSDVGSEAWVKNTLLQKHKMGTYTNKEALWEELKPLTTSQTYRAGFKAAKKEDPTFGKVGAPSKKSEKKSNPDE